MTVKIILQFTGGHKKIVPVNFKDLKDKHWKNLGLLLKLICVRTKEYLENK